MALCLINAREGLGFETPASRLRGKCCADPLSSHAFSDKWIPVHMAGRTTHFYYNWTSSGFVNLARVLYGLRSIHQFVAKTAFAIIICTPSLPSTSSVMCKSAATLASM
jgi:hypothetical protein